MVPGLAGKVNENDIDERQFDRMSAIITSMTKKEREKPQILAASRKRRIAAGAGVKVEDVNRLLKQYEQMKSMFKGFTGKGKKRRAKFNMNGMPGNFGGMNGMGGMGGFPGL